VRRQFPRPTEQELIVAWHIEEKGQLESRLNITNFLQCSPEKYLVGDPEREIIITTLEGNGGLESHLEHSSYHSSTSTTLWKSKWYSWVEPHLPTVLLHTVKFGQLTSEYHWANEETKSIFVYDFGFWLGHGLSLAGRNGATMSKVIVCQDNTGLCAVLSHYPVKHSDIELNKAHNRNIKNSSW
jgi:hypothetical protein